MNEKFVTTDGLRLLFIVTITWEQDTCAHLTSYYKSPNTPHPTKKRKRKNWWRIQQHQFGFKKPEMKLLEEAFLNSQPTDLRKVTWSILNNLIHNEIMINFNVYDPSMKHKVMHKRCCIDAICKKHRKRSKKNVQIKNKCLKANQLSSCMFTYRHINCV